MSCAVSRVRRALCVVVLSAPPRPHSRRRDLCGYFGGASRERPPRLPLPIWAAYATADEKVSLEMVREWQRLARRDDEFYVLEVEGAHHLMHKDEGARVHHMSWLIDAVRESGVPLTYSV